MTLPGTDVGSAVANTHYTTDGSDPTLASPIYTSTDPGHQHDHDQVPVVGQRRQHRRDRRAGHPANLAAGHHPARDDDRVRRRRLRGPPATTGRPSVSMTADDAGGWGVDKTYYTTDGTTPTTASTVYSAPFTLNTPATYTVKYFSTDLAGNAESTQTQQITVLPPRVVVSLTFDDGIENQYTLGVLHALQPHHINGTFYNISGLTDVDPQHMTWAELTALNEDGNEIGGHTVDHVNLKTMTDNTDKTYEACQARQDLIDHGFYPTSFAYPRAPTTPARRASCRAAATPAGGPPAASTWPATVPARSTPRPSRRRTAYAMRTLYDPPDGHPANVPPLTLAHLRPR